MWTEQQYDAQIKELTENPHLIPTQWSGAVGLFKSLGDDRWAGCPTMIRNNSKQYGIFINKKLDSILTKELENDNRIPKYGHMITPKDFSIFKEWQMKIDILQTN